MEANEYLNGEFISARKNYLVLIANLSQGMFMAYL